MPKLTRKQRLARTILSILAIVALWVIVTSLWYVEGNGYCIGSFTSCHA
jgi:hypothetical protein